MLETGLAFLHLKGRICGYSSRLVSLSTLPRFCREIADAENADTRLDSYAYWGDVNEAGNDHVRQEVLDFACPTQQPEQLRDSLTKTVPKARIVPNKLVMQTKRDQYERWKQATSKELNTFLKTAWKEPTAETKPRYFAKKQKVVMQLLVFTLKPMTAEKRALGLQGEEYEKARICLQGQNHEGFQVHNSTNNADAHLLRLFLSVFASSKNVLPSFDVSNAFLNAELSEDVTILTQPAPELVQLVLSSLARFINVPRLAMVFEKHLNFARNRVTRL